MEPVHQFIARISCTVYESYVSGTDEQRHIICDMGCTGSICFCGNRYVRFPQGLCKSSGFIRRFVSDHLILYFRGDGPLCHLRHHVADEERVVVSKVDLQGLTYRVTDDKSPRPDMVSQSIADRSGIRLKFLRDWKSGSRSGICKRRMK